MAAYIQNTSYDPEPIDQDTLIESILVGDILVKGTLSILFSITRSR